MWTAHEAVLQESVSKGNRSAIICIIFWNFLTFYQIFLSPQPKRCAIITYKRGIYELPYELPNDLWNIRNVPKPHRMIAHCPVPAKINNPPQAGAPKCTRRAAYEHKPTNKKQRKTRTCNRGMQGQAHVSLILS